MIRLVSGIIPHPRTGGFTLIEMLVGITIFSMVIVALFAGYRIGMRSWEAGERAHAVISELRLASSFTRRHLSQAFPLAVSDGKAWRLWFLGEPGRVVFVTTMPAYLGEGGMYEMTLDVHRQDDGEALMVSRRLLHPDSEPGRPGVEDRPRPLAEHLESARFAFYGAPRKDAEEVWQEHWDFSQQRLPSLVRLRLRSKLTGQWPDLVIRLPTNAVRYQRSAAGGLVGEQAPNGGLPPEEGSILAPGLMR